MNRSRPRLILVVCGLGMLFLSGCGGSESLRRPMEGEVRVDGVAVERGAISFLPAKGTSGPAANGTIVEGRYRFTSESGPYAGPHRVLLDVDTQPEAAAAAGSTDVEFPEDVKRIKVDAARPPGRRTRPPPRPEPTAKTHWQLEYTVPGEGEFQKDFDLSQ
jgi:hypothetical protein